MIQTPVGAKCRDCAQLRKLPMFDIKPMGYVRAVGAALGAGVGGAVVLTLVQGTMPFFGLFGLLFMAAFGYVVGEAVSLAVRRKQGNQLGMIAAAGVCVGLIVVRTLMFMMSSAPPELALIGALVSIGGSIWGLLGVALAAGIAFSRAR